MSFGIAPHKPLEQEPGDSRRLIAAISDAICAHRRRPGTSTSEDSVPTAYDNHAKDHIKVRATAENFKWWRTRLNTGMVRYVFIAWSSEAVNQVANSAGILWVPAGLPVFVEVHVDATRVPVKGSESKVGTTYHRLYRDIEMAVFNSCGSQSQLRCVFKEMKLRQ